VVNPRDYGAVGDEATDDSAAFTAALAEALGVLSGKTNVGAVEVHIPAGVYVIASPRVFHLMQGHSGIVFRGAGMYLSVIKYTYDADEADNYLIYHDEATDDGLFRPAFYDLGFSGPGGGSTHHANWFYNRGDSSGGGTGGLTVQDCVVEGFRTGYRIEGTTGTDTGTFIRFVVRDVWRVFSIANPQATSMQLVGPDIVSSSNDPTSDVFYFDVGASCHWTITGGFLGAGGYLGAVFHFSAAYTGSNGSLTVVGTHIELLGGTPTLPALNDSRLVRDESMDRIKVLGFFNAVTNVMQGGNRPRTSVNLNPRSTFLFYGGQFGGLVELNTDAGATGGSPPPQFTLMDAAWDQDSASYTAPTENLVTQAAPPVYISPVATDSALRPRITYKNVRVIGVGYLDDRDTGPPASRVSVANMRTWEDEAGGTLLVQTADGLRVGDGTLGLQIGDPAGITPGILERISVGSVAWDPPSLGQGASVSKSIPVAGALPTDFILVTFSGFLQGMDLRWYVSSNNNVTAILTNTTVSVIDLGAGTLSALAIRVA
jgi:hypothetical protein